MRMVSPPEGGVSERVILSGLQLLGAVGLALAQLDATLPARGRDYRRAAQLVADKGERLLLKANGLCSASPLN